MELAPGTPGRKDLRESNDSEANRFRANAIQLLQQWSQLDPKEQTKRLKQIGFSGETPRDPYLDTPHIPWNPENDLEILRFIATNPEIDSVYTARRIMWLRNRVALCEAMTEAPIIK